MDGQAMTGGFENGPVDAAHAFRAALNAMARPGRIETLSGGVAPAPASPAAATLLLTLCDPETPLHLAGDHNTEAMRDWVAFHLGAPLVEADNAAFALGTLQALLPLTQYPVGTPEYPDRSATLIVEMPELSGKGATLRGPGIRDTTHLSLPDIEAFAANARGFPLGLDFFFTCKDQAAALPRTTKVEG